MKLPVSYLRDQLKNDGNLHIIAVPDLDIPLSRPKFHLPGELFESGRLYICDVLPTPEDTIPDSTVLLITPHTAALLNQVQGLYDQCEEWEEALQTSSVTGEVRDLLDEIETILDNPIVLHKSNYSIVACSSEVYSNEALLSLRGSHLPYAYVNVLKRDPIMNRTAAAIVCSPATIPLQIHRP